jgi:serine/threonine-protein kinase/endoribonuclease IRE1
LLQTLSFSTYGPNNINKPLQALWKRTPDDIYLQPSWDGRTYAFETLAESAIWAKSFHQPIVAVFDVVLHDSGTGSGHRPIVLSQPRPRLQELFPTRAAQLEGIRAKTVVHRIGESLFAMGHLNYPLVNLADITLQIEDGTDPKEGEQGSRSCHGLSCYVGVRYAEREGPESRISRLIEPPRPEQHSNAQIVPRDVEEDSPAADSPNNSIPTPPEVAAPTFPTRFTPTASSGADGFVGLPSQGDNVRIKPTGAPLWTLTLPFVGGVLAIWFILRKFMHMNAPEDRHLIRPLQNPTQSRDARQPLLATTPRHSHSRHSSRHVLQDESISGIKYSIDTDHSATASPRVRQNPEILNEKTGQAPESSDVDVNVSLALEEARVGTGLGVTVDLKDDDSDKDEGDQQDGKKRRRRGNRGKKNKKQPPSNVVTSPSETGPGAASSSSGPDTGSGGYVIVEPSSVKMELPMPVTTSTSSLVVGNKVLGQSI